MWEVVSVYIHLTNTTAAQNEVALSYHSMRGLYFLAVVFVRSIVIMTSFSHLITNKGTRIIEPL